MIDTDQAVSSADRDVIEYTKTMASGKKFIDKDYERDIQMQKENSDTVNSPFFMALTKEEIIDAKRQQLKELKEEEDTPAVQENVDEGTVDTTVNFL